MNRLKLLLVIVWVYFTFSVQLSFSQLSGGENNIAQVSDYESKFKKNVPKTSVDINQLYDYERMGSTEYFIRKSPDIEYTYDFFNLLRSNENFIIDTLSKAVKWKGKDFLEVYVNGKKLPYNELHLYYYLKNLKSTDFNKMEIIGYTHPKYKNGSNVGIINVIR